MKIDPSQPIAPSLPVRDQQRKPQRQKQKGVDKEKKRSPQQDNDDTNHIDAYA